MQVTPRQHGRPGRQNAACSALLFGLAGFALAQTIYNLILGTPEFLVARQNTRTDMWLLVATLSFLLPAVMALTVVVANRLSPLLGRACCLVLTFALCSLFMAQLLRDLLGHSMLLFSVATLALAGVFTWLLLFTRFRALGTALAVLALVFPLMFMLNVPDLGDGGGLGLDETYAGTPSGELAPLIMVLADELPLATLLREDGEIDPLLFPHIHELQQTSTWYRNTTTVADGTLEAVSAILSGRYPKIEAVPATIASLPVNLFTLLSPHYEFNVVESLSRLCPSTHCPADTMPTGQRFPALLLDLSALFLHRVSPDSYRHQLPNVSDNWSGFFAEKQEFFPEGWVAFAHGQATGNRPGIFRRFIDSIGETGQPGLNFIHILFPHVPYVYLPDGRNYGNHWLRGLENERWHDSPWGLLNGKQRHYLQARYFDALLGELMARLRSLGQFDDSLIVLVADHGAAFRVNQPRRTLSPENLADILRVPLLIKAPHQVQAKLVDQPVMTIDIVPTLLSTLGFEQVNASFDGADIGEAELPQARERPVLSYELREFKTFSEPELNVDALVRENREQLALDDPEKALWGIGPYGEYRGLSLDSLCRQQSTGIRISPSAVNPLADTTGEEYLPAFVSGTFHGELENGSPLQFVISQDDTIVASGETWEFSGIHHFFALVSPDFIPAQGWSPSAWIVRGDSCAGQSVYQ
jgi:hypothetical protein